MIKYIDSQIVFREFPDEITLAINLTLCPNKCVGCHSDYLQHDIGKELTTLELDALLHTNDGITCVGFMGGDNDVQSLTHLAEYVKENYPDLKTGWYSGKNEIGFSNPEKYFDYIKLGNYDSKFGPLDSNTTNQRLYYYNPFFSDCTYPGKSWRDITYKFWNKKQ